MMNISENIRNQIKDNKEQKQRGLFEQYCHSFRGAEMCTRRSRDRSTIECILKDHFNSKEECFEYWCMIQDAIVNRLKE